jgi:hypothetical protein
MSTHTHKDQSDPAPARGGARSTAMKAVAAVAAIAVLAFGANAVTNGNAASTTGTAASNGQTAPGGRPGTGAPPRMGAAVTGATLTKLKAAATAKYPGTVERAMKLPNGSYLVHVLQSGGKGEVHVLVSKAFQVTGVQQGGPPGGAPPAGANPPSGTAPSTSQS